MFGLDLDKVFKMKSQPPVVEKPKEAPTSVSDNLLLLLKEDKIKMFRLSPGYETESIGRHPGANQLQAPCHFYESRAHAIADADGTPLPTVRALTKLTKQREGGCLFLQTSAGLKTFEGQKALSRLKFVHPRRIGEDRNAVLGLVTSNSYSLTLSEDQLIRFMQGSCAFFGGSGQEYIRRLCRKDDVIRVYTKNCEVPQRYYEGIDTFHAETLMIIKWCEKSFPEHSVSTTNVLRFLLTTMIADGKFGSTDVTRFLDQVEVVHNPQKKGILSEWIFSLPRPLQITLFRLRRGIFKDEGSLFEIGKELLNRRALESVPYTCETDRILANWFMTLEPYLKAEIKFEFNYLKSSAGAIVTRSDGGGALEIQFFVGLYRLFNGEESRLFDVWGDLENYNEESFITQYKRGLESEKEIRGAANMLLDWLEDDIELPTGFTHTIFPERERKSRTFILEYPLLEIFTRPVVEVAKNCLRDQPETASFFSNTNTCQILSSFEAEEMFDSDSQFSTDYYPLDLPLKFYGPIIKKLNDPLVSRVFNFLCSERKLVITKERPRLHDCVNLRSITTFEQYLPHISPNLPKKKTVKKVTLSRIPTDKVESLRIYRHKDIVLDAINQSESFILKAPTGTGKTIFMASLGKVIISLPVIPQLHMLAHSLEHFGILYHLLHEGRERPDEDFEGAILCTPPYVESLLRKRKGWIYVNDEGDTALSSVQLNSSLFQKNGVMQVICTATPSKLKLDCYVLELESERPAEVHDMGELESIKLMFSKIREVILDPEDDSLLEDVRILIVTYSEPNAIDIAKKLSTMFGTEFRPAIGGMSPEETVAIFQQQVIVATNRVRASVTIEGLTHVFDLGLRYLFITDEATGLVVGVITRVSNSDKDQLFGRLGRMDGIPGFYYRVRVKRRASPNHDIVTDTLDIAKNYRRLKPAEVVRDCSLSDYIRHLMDIVFVSIELQISPKSDTFRFQDPWALFFKKTEISATSRQKLLLVYAFRKFNVEQSMRELSRFDDERATIYESFQRYMSQHAPFKACFFALKQAKNLGLMNKETRMCSNLSKIDFDNPRDLFLFDDLTTQKERNAFAFFHWQQWCVVKANISTGVIRNFSISNPELPEGTLFAPIGLHYSQSLGCLQYSYALEVDVNFEAFQELFSHKAKEMPVTILESWPRTYVELVGKDNSSSLVISGQPRARSAIYQPELAPIIKKRLFDHLEEITEHHVFAKAGVNMASLISVPVLSGVTLACARDVTDGRSDIVIRLNGDDVIGKGPKQINHGRYPEASKPLEAVSQARNNFGLREKPEASATQHDRLSVFCERFFDLHGQEFYGVKPHSFVGLWQCKNDCFSFNQSDEENYTDLIEGTKRHHPQFISANGWDEISSTPKTRVTATRLAALKLIKSSEAGGGDVHRVLANRLLLKVERAMFAVCPPSKGDSRTRILTNNEVTISNKQYLHWQHIVDDMMR